PPGLHRRLAEWSEGTAAWLRRTGTRLVVACRAEYWERAGTEFPRDLLYESATVPSPAPPRVLLGDLTDDEARQARARLGVPDGALADADSRHPLTLRLYSEVRTALGGPPPAADADPHAPLRRDDVFAAHLDLVCLR
ncbi:serine protease, partial [Streptomyces sp. TRM76130]|nr:serine protease [Streptomyces sp. TRM76130]